MALLPLFVAAAAAILVTTQPALVDAFGPSNSGCDDWAAAKTFCSGGGASFEPGVAYPQAHTTAGPTTASEAECCCACAGEPTCNGWTLNPHDKACFLKSNAGPPYAVKNTAATSGLMPPRPAPPPYKPLYPTPKGAKNVLFLAVDDMRPSLGAYNFTLPGQPTHSPNIDKLAAQGTVFTHAYVQYAYCSPSRNSFMTGRRPDTTKVWEFADHFREVGVGKEWVSMPQYFKQFGYLTLGGGKLYHPSSSTENIGMPFMDWPESWSPDHPYFFPKDDVSDTTCADQGPFPLPPNSPPSGYNKTNPVDKARKYVWCAMNVDKDDSVLFGQQVRDNCIANIELAAKPSAGGRQGTDGADIDGDGGHTGTNYNTNYSRPFFIGCGFHKPHAPYYAPKEFFDRLPDWQDVPLPDDPFAPVGMPMVACT